MGSSGGLESTHNSAASASAEPQVSQCHCVADKVVKRSSPSVSLGYSNMMTPIIRKL